MSTQIAVRLSDAELAVLDAEVANHRARNRSEAVRRSIRYLDRRHRYQHDNEILARLQAAGEEPYPDLVPVKATVWPDGD
jgi:Arc/MetJ-type ribon-helix-helix transcriptional regulator